MIKLSVPGTLVYRDVVLRVTASACKLVRGADGVQDTGHAVASDFENQVVSAVSEAFNNVAIHGYAKGAAGDVELELEIAGDALAIRLSDTGKGYVATAAPRPDPGALPESRMGLFIIESFMDEVGYRRASVPGERNVLTLKKRRR
jgi:serine/threonine-protein kinase RsbW